MNLVYAQIVDVSNDPEGKTARVRVGGAIRKVTVELIREVQPGDRVLVCDGVAIAKADDSRIKNHENHVFGNSR